MQFIKKKIEVHLKWGGGGGRLQHTSQLFEMIKKGHHLAYSMQAKDTFLPRPQLHGPQKYIMKKRLATPYLSF